MKVVNINAWSGAVFGVEFRRTAGTASLAAQQFRAMLVKHVIHSWRNRIFTVGQLLFPVVLAVLACVSALAVHNSTDSPPLPLDLRHFDKSTILFTSVGSGSLAPSLARSYSDVASRYGRTVDVGDENMDDYLLDVAKRSLDDYNQRYIVAATARSSGNNSLIGHFNNFALHSIAISLSLVDNAVLRYAVPGSQPIVTVNHPLPQTASTSTSNTQMSLAALMFSVIFSLGLLFLVGMLVVFIAKQCATKSRHCQFVNGVNAIIYWLAAVIWDLAVFAVSSVLITVIVLAFQPVSYTHLTLPTIYSV